MNPLFDIDMKLLHLTSLLAVALLAIPGGATARQPKFGDDGKFKIIQFTDAHVRADKPDEMAKTIDRLVRTIDAEAPDMIVFTGDVVTGRPAAKAWRAILDPVARRNIPFVVVLGNHDREQDLREELRTDVFRISPCRSSRATRSARRQSCTASIPTTTPLSRG